MNTQTTHSITEEELVPQLRFPEFQEVWNRIKLKDVSEYFNGGSFESDVQQIGRFELVTLKSIDISGNLVSSKRYIDVEVKTLAKDTLVMILSEQAPGLLGKTALIPKNDKYVLNQRIAEIRPNKEIDSYFLSMAINRNQRYFSKMGAGMKVQNISKPNVENYTFYSTEFQEQQKIASFLTAVDTKLQQLTSKKELLQQYKKGVMQQLFSQQLRFKQKDGSNYPDWEEKKLGEICEMTSSKRVYLNDYVSEGIPFYRGKEISELRLNQTPSDILFITEERYFDFKKKYGVPLKNDILITAVGTLGNVLRIRNSNPFYFKDGNLIWLREIKVSPNFLEILLEWNTRELIKTSIGSTQKALTMVELRKIKFMFPSKEEQQQIASYLSALDTKIETVTQQIETTQQFKKGLLQQMFV